MYTKHILSALVASVGLVSAQSDPCTQPEFTINSQADITGLGRCRTLRGNVVIGEQTDSKLDFSGFTTIDGDFTCLNNKLVTDISSSSISEITGAFHLQNLTALSTLGFTMLREVGSINFVTLRAIDTLTFTTGISSARSVVISDTFLSSLNGLNMVSVESMDINNNNRLVQWNSQLNNLSKTLIINANGLNLAITFPNLKWINEARISNVSTFEMPSLAVVNDSLRFDSNFFRSIAAPNLTNTETGDISFVSNPQLTNISMPSLTSLGGGLLIANNTALSRVDGFPLLRTVGGAVKFRGNFSDIALPALNDVKGAFDVVSTTDITAICQRFNTAGQVQGTYTCEGNRADANSDTSSDSNGGGSNSAAGVVLNTASLLGAVVFGFFALL